MLEETCFTYLKIGYKIKVTGKILIKLNGSYEIRANRIDLLSY
jgi:hypothetical protein